MNFDNSRLELRGAEQNENEIARLTAARLSPDNLPPGAKKALADAQAAREAAERAENLFVESLRAQRELESMRADHERLLADISEAQALLTRVNGDIELWRGELEVFPAVARRQGPDLPRVVFILLENIRNAEATAGFLPGWIERRRAEIPGREAAIEKFRKSNRL